MKKIILYLTLMLLPLAALLHSSKAIAISKSIPEVTSIAKVSIDTKSEILSKDKSNSNLLDFFAKKGKSKTIALLLVLLGAFGAHRFYMDHQKEGLMHLGLTAAALIFAAIGGGLFSTLAIILWIVHLLWLIYELILIVQDKLKPSGGFTE